VWCDPAQVLGNDLSSNWAVIEMLTKYSRERVQRLEQIKTCALTQGHTHRGTDAGAARPDIDCNHTSDGQPPAQLTMQPLSSQASVEAVAGGRGGGGEGRGRVSDVGGLWDPGGGGFGRITALLAGKLAFVVFEDQAQTKKAIIEQRDVFFFSSALHELYQPFSMDFGPVNLGVVYKFCHLIDEKIKDPRLEDRLCTYYAEQDGPRRTNAAFLIGAYLIIQHGWTPEEANLVFEGMGEGILWSFRHALSTPSDFKLSVLDCLRGIKKALDLKWFELATFDLDRYQLLENARSFDLHQICPKLLAFRGPDDRGQDSRFHKSDHYCELFKNIGVTAVVRLNSTDTYSPSAFTNAGIHHYDLNFPDCSVPPAYIADRFLNICDAEGIVAVHCLAGLGRTGTLIAIWMMTRHNWRAREAIGWLRIVRPGNTRTLTSKH
jgi:cell division cycle 14